MKKEWTKPEVKDLSLVDTEYDPKGGNIQDGYWQDPQHSIVIKYYS